MGSGNHIDRQVEAEDLSDFRCNQTAEWRQDVGVVTLALFEQFSLVNFVVKQTFVAVVLTEGVVTEQHRIAGHVGHHTVRPVQHRRFNEDQLLAVTNVQRITGFHYVKVPFRVMVVPVDRVNGVGGAVNRRVRDAGHQLGQRPGMVFFSVVNDDVVDIREVNFTAQVLHEFTTKLVVYCINQNIFFFTDEVAVVAAAAQRFVFSSVEITHFPVTLANPMNVIFNQNRHNNLN